MCQVVEGRSWIPGQEAFRLTEMNQEIMLEHAERIVEELGPNPNPATLHPAPWTLNPGPWTLHHAPWTLDPEPSTLNPAPRTLHPESRAVPPAP